MCSEARPRPARLLGLVAAIGFATACNGVGRDRPDPPRNDVEFLDDMIPHHEVAVVMVDEVLARGDASDVRIVAERIKEDELAAIERMRSIRSELTRSMEPPHDSPEAQMKADLSALPSLSAEALDDQFLREMIAHHAQGVLIIHRARPNLESEAIREMADRSFTEQPGVMKELADLLAD